MASSDGHDFLQFRQSGSTVWIAIVIFIKWLASRLIGTVRSSSNGQRKIINLIAVRSRSDDHDALDLSLTLEKLPERWILIERMTTVVKPDRAIGPPTLPNQIRRQRSIVSQDRGSRSRFDRGPIAPQSGLIYHEIEATITTK